MNDIFSHFIARGDKEDDMKRLSYAAWFTGAIPSSEFESDELLFYEYLRFSSQLNVPVTFKYLQLWCSTELREVLHRTEARVLGCESLRFEDPASFETLFQTTSKVLEDNFKVLEMMESNVDDFKVEMSSYFSTKRKESLTKALSKTFNVLNDTDNSEQAADYAESMICEARSIYDGSKLVDIENTTTDSSLVKMEFVTDSGIPAIDNDSQGIFTTQLFGIEGSSGAGKTRLALGTWIYRALTVHKKNVLFLELEQSEEEIKAMLIALHVFQLFNIQITDKMICSDTVPDELKTKVEAAKIDLFESGKYGKFVVKATTLYVETFILEIKTLDRLKGPFDLICIDYMGLLESKPLSRYETPKDMVECIRRGYRLFKLYVRDNKKAGIAIGQLNKEGVIAGNNDKNIETDMAQGGMAVFQNTDYNVEITVTPTMKLQQKRRISQAKVRSSEGLVRFLVDVRLGFLYFKQVVREKV